MKRLFLMCVLAISVLFGAELVGGNVASAQDVWACSDGSSQVYVATETIERNGSSIRVNLKYVHSNGDFDWGYLMYGQDGDGNWYGRPAMGAGRAWRVTRGSTDERVINICLQYS